MDPDYILIRALAYAIIALENAGKYDSADRLAMLETLRTRFGISEERLARSAHVEDIRHQLRPE